MNEADSGNEAILELLSEMLELEKKKKSDITAIIDLHLRKRLLVSCRSSMSHSYCKHT